jgi:hypothetical protein
MHEEEEFKEFFSEIIDWNLIFTMINTFAHVWDEPMVRMMKSFLISKAIETFSENKMRFVNETGLDFIVTWKEKEIRIEFKYGKNIFQTDRTRLTSSVKLDNTNGKSSYFKQYKQTFDYLLLVDLNKAAFITHDKLQQYISNNGDGRSVKIDKKDLIFFKECSIAKSTKKIYLDDEWSKFCDIMMENVSKIYYSK